MQIWSVYNLKGGVGKTATAVNLAYQAAREGYSVLLWDLDPQGAATWYLRAKPGLTVKTSKLIKGKVPIGKVIRSTVHENLDLIPADFAYRNLDVLLKKVQGDERLLKRLITPCSEVYSLVIVDCPPSLSKLAESIFAMSDVLLMPLIPGPLSTRAYEQVRAHLKELKRKPWQVVPFFSMVDGRRSLHRNWLAQPPASIKKPLKTTIPYASVIEKMGEHRAPVEVFARSTPAAAAYRRLWAEVKARDGEL